MTPGMVCSDSRKRAFSDCACAVNVYERPRDYGARNEKVLGGPRSSSANTRFSTRLMFGRFVGTVVRLLGEHQLGRGAAKVAMISGGSHRVSLVAQHTSMRCSAGDSHGVSRVSAWYCSEGKLVWWRSERHQVVPHLFRTREGQRVDTYIHTCCSQNRHRLNPKSTLQGRQQLPTIKTYSL